MAARARTQLFISYSREDADWLRRLQIVLRPLTRNQNLDVWDDTRIQDVSKWRAEIQQAVALARAAVLLVSPNFLDSECIANDELPPLLKAAEEEGLTILWVAVSASLYEVTAIAAYQAANNSATPSDALSSSALNAELVKIAQKILEAATRPIVLRPANSPANISPKMVGEPLLPKLPFEPEMILIPAGEFRIGSEPQQDRDAVDDEQPQHRLSLPD